MLSLATPGLLNTTQKLIGRAGVYACPAAPRCCTQCRDDAWKERRTQKKEEENLAACSRGLRPTWVEDKDGDKDESLTTTEESPMESNQIWVVSLPQYIKRLEIQAAATTSQRLAEASKCEANLKAEVSPGQANDNLHIQCYFKEFKSVFSDRAFQTLPDPCPWDHAIELIPGADPSNCKLYPLSPAEQKELDAFLEENLQLGHICPSKSSMASPVFFIKKKDGSLCLVQDYCTLNALTIKNKYPSQN